MTIREDVASKIRALDIDVACAKEDVDKVRFPIDELLNRYHDMSVYEYTVDSSGVVRRAKVGYPDGKTRLRKGVHYYTRHCDGTLFSTGWTDVLIDNWVEIMLEEATRVPYGYYDDEPKACHKCGAVLKDNEMGIYRNWDFGYTVRLCRDCVKVYDDDVQKILNERWENAKEAVKNERYFVGGGIGVSSPSFPPSTPIPHWAKDEKVEEKA
jgi:hypothetical protein